MSRKLVKPAEEKAQARESIRLSGRNIYTDKQGRTIYYDWVTKQGYLIEKKSEKAALFYKNRFAVILMAAILFGATFLTVIQAVIAGAVMLVLAMGGATIGGPDFSFSGIGLGIISGILLNLIMPEAKEPKPGLVAHSVPEE